MMMGLPRKFQRQVWAVGAITGLIMASASGLFMSSQAVQLSDGSTSFVNPPRLEEFVPNRNLTNQKDITYYATIDLLPDAGEPLKTLTVELIEGRFTRLDYHVEAIEVYGEVAGNREDYAIASADYDDNTQTLTIQLAEGVPPGRQVTFALKPVRNPSRSGVYLFDVMAAPGGDQPRSQRAGFGRVQIYQRRYLTPRG
ncbi:MAG: DUF2808 domain-containing protein [Leptolyngbyaceae cyanobacterium]